MHIFYSSKKSAQCSNIKSSQGCFDELGSIWDEWAISMSFSLKTAADEAGDRRKGPLLRYVAVIRKRTLRATRTFPQGPLGAQLYQALNHNAPLACSGDLLGSKHSELYSNIPSHFHVRPCVFVRSC